MAVDFSLLPPEVPVPDDRPSRFLWSFVFVGLTLGGIAIALWCWPRDEKTQTPWFWTKVVVIPACVAGICVLQRFASFYKRRNRALSDNTIRKAYTDILFDVASVPLAVLATAHRVHIDDAENTFDAMLARSSSPPTRAARDSHEMIVASCLEPPEAALTFDDEERQRAVLQWIFESFAPIVSDALSSVPKRIALEIYLEIGASDLSREAILAAWECLPASVWPPRLNTRLASESGVGLWLVDTILDRENPEDRDVMTLVISANLNPLRARDPDSGSAEAACMMLLCPAALAHNEALSVAGWFHRPQADTRAPQGNAVRYALKWGCTTGTDVVGTMQTGFDEDDAAQLRVALCSGDRSTSVPSSSDFALDTLAGNIGSSAPWLATVLALDRANASAAPYVVGVKDEQRTLFAVLVPPHHHPQQDILKNA